MKRRRRRILVGGALGAMALVAFAIAIAAFRGPDLVAWDELDRRWGTYLSEREWGTPREAVGSNPWGMDYLRAIRLPYTHGEDGIAGIVDRDGTFHIGWAVWDEKQVRVAERLFGWGNPSGEHGEEIVDRRTFGPNTPSSSFAESTLIYPNTDPRYRVVFTEARADGRSGVLLATADRNVPGEPLVEEELPLHLVLKGWFHDTDLLVEQIEDGLLLRGPTSTVAIVGAELTGPAGRRRQARPGREPARRRTGRRRSGPHRGAVASAHPGTGFAIGGRLRLGRVSGRRRCRDPCAAAPV